MNNFLPDDYKVPAGESKYMRFEQGANKFRILQKPIFGWEAWSMPDSENPNGKPIRFRMEEKPVDLREYKNQRISHFWAMPVWNFQTGQIEVLELTQKSILRAIEALARNEDWGSPLEYNITVSREGENMDTKYQVTPSPKNEMPEEATTAFADLKDFNIERMFEGGDPFSVDQETKISKEDIPFE